MNFIIALVIIGPLFVYMVYLSAQLMRNIDTKSRYGVTMIIFINFVYLVGIPTMFGVAYDSIQIQFGGCLDGYQSSSDAFYFSYTTFTTLGYGDVKPLGWCRLLTSVEAMTGYLGLGVLAALMFNLLSNADEKHKPTIGPRNPENMPRQRGPKEDEKP